MKVEYLFGLHQASADGFRRRTIKNKTMLTGVDGRTDGRKSVRRGLVHIRVQNSIKRHDDVKTTVIYNDVTST